MKKIVITQTRLSTLNGQEQKNTLRKSSSPFDDALKGLGVSERKKESETAKKKAVQSKV
jgi:hypothetical protein